GGYVIARLKAAASRELHAAGFFKDLPIWKKGGNPGEIKTSGYFCRVYDYVLNSQTDKPLSIPS
ncbi:MAG: hypothetical protein J6X44_00990, partial [Thermoguttaceae bacterium]|nr:hypothetical protein [Thermoguttaceae bacterium]